MNDLYYVKPCAKVNKFKWMAPEMEKYSNCIIKLDRKYLTQKKDEEGYTWVWCESALVKISSTNKEKLFSIARKIYD